MEKQSNLVKVTISEEEVKQLIKMLMDLYVVTMNDKTIPTFENLQLFIISLQLFFNKEKFKGFIDDINNL